jgi:hypothetical protein
MTDAKSTALATDIQPRKRLRQLRRVKTMDDLRGASRDARREIKRGAMVYTDAIDGLCEIAERSNLCRRLGTEFVYDFIRAELTAGGTDDEIEERPAYVTRAVTAKDLQTMKFPPVHYVLPGLIPDGLTILAAKPKAKKSWLMLDLAIGVAAGRYVLGTLKPAEGDVLYLALEDSARRLQRRMDKLLGTFVVEWPKRLQIVTEWPRGSDAVCELEAWCVAHPIARLIVIDTFEKVRAPDSGGRL